MSAVQICVMVMTNLSPEHWNEPHTETSVDSVQLKFIIIS